MSRKNLTVIGGCVGLMLFFLGVYLKIDHRPNGAVFILIGMTVMALLFGPALLAKSYDVLVRRNGWKRQQES
jgi:amino acid transporter